MSTAITTSSSSVYRRTRSRWPIRLADLADNMDITRLDEFTKDDQTRLAKYERAKRRLLTALP